MYLPHKSYSSSLMVLKLNMQQKHLKDLLKYNHQTLVTEFLTQQVWGLGLNICTSSKFPDKDEAASPRPHSENNCSRSFTHSAYFECPTMYSALLCIKHYSSVEDRTSLTCPPFMVLNSCKKRSDMEVKSKLQN